jgi:hypothetical protein
LPRSCVVCCEGRVDVDDETKEDGVGRDTERVSGVANDETGARECVL